MAIVSKTNKTDIRLYESEYLKRRSYFEPLIALILTVFLTPLLLLIFLLLTATLMEKPIFIQQRIGFRNTPFNLIKFKSMRTQDFDVPSFTENEDPGFRTCYFLRKHRLDELLQLINVIIGQMAIVGPRPEQTHFSNIYQKKFPGYLDRYSAKPGITGLAQVKLGYTSDDRGAARKLKYDKFYITHASLKLDLLIICKTIKIILFGNVYIKRR